MKDLFKWIEGLCRSVIIVVGSNREVIFWSRWPTKKVHNTLSNFGLKKFACAISWKVTFNVVKDVFKWIEGLCRSVIILVSSNRGYFSSWWPTKKVLNTLSNFELKKYAYAISWKVTFNVVKDFFKWIEGLCRSVIILVNSNREIIFDLGGLRKKYSIRCQISGSKNMLVQFHEKRLSMLWRTFSNELRVCVGVS